MKSKESTTISINYISGDKSSLMIDKWISDFLHTKHGKGVHALCQRTYDRVTKTYPQKSRRWRGDMTRKVLASDPEIANLL